MARKGTVIAGLLAVVAAAAMVQRPVPMSDAPDARALQVLPVAVAPMTAAPASRPHVAAASDVLAVAKVSGAVAPATEVRPALIAPLVLPPAGLPAVGVAKSTGVAPLPSGPTRLLAATGQALARPMPVPKNGDVPPISRAAAVPERTPTPGRAAAVVIPLAPALTAGRIRATDLWSAARKAAAVPIKPQSYKIAAVTAPRPRAAPGPRLAPGARIQ
jgi:hypothetical protein